MTKKTSFLQESIIERIDKFCGIEKLDRFLTRFQDNKSSAEKLRILTIQHYYKSLYLYYVPVEEDCIAYRDTIFDNLAFLKGQKDSRDSDYVRFLINNISAGLNYIEKIKKLA